MDRDTEVELQKALAAAGRLIEKLMELADALLEDVRADQARRAGR